MSAAVGLNDNSQAELEGYDLVLRLATGNVANLPRVRRRIALALLYKGVTLSALNRSEEEIDAYDRLLQRFGDATEPALREQVATALVYKGLTLAQLKQGARGSKAFRGCPRTCAAAASRPGILQQSVSPQRTQPCRGGYSRISGCNTALW